MMLPGVLCLFMVSCTYGGASGLFVQSMSKSSVPHPKSNFVSSMIEILQYCNVPDVTAIWNSNSYVVTLCDRNAEFEDNVAKIKHLAEMDFNLFLCKALYVSSEKVCQNQTLQNFSKVQLPAPTEFCHESVNVLSNSGVFLSKTEFWAGEYVKNIKNETKCQSVCVTGIAINDLCAGIFVLNSILLSYEKATQTNRNKMIETENQEHPETSQHAQKPEDAKLVQDIILAKIPQHQDEKGQQSNTLFIADKKAEYPFKKSPDIFTKEKLPGGIPGMVNETVEPSTDRKTLLNHTILPSDILSSDLVNYSKNEEPVHPSGNGQLKSDTKEKPALGNVTHKADSTVSTNSAVSNLKEPVQRGPALNIPTVIKDDKKSDDRSKTQPQVSPTEVPIHKKLVSSLENELTNTEPPGESPFQPDVSYSDTGHPDDQEDDINGGVAPVENTGHLSEDEDFVPKGSKSISGGHLSKDEDFLHKGPTSIPAGHLPKDKDFLHKGPKSIPAANIQTQGAAEEGNIGFVKTEDSHFFAYFMTMIVLCIIGYLVFHNKHKILALALEGRSRKGNRRRPNTAGYRKLDSNLEEAVTSQCSSSSVTHVIY